MTDSPVHCIEEGTNNIAPSTTPGTFNMIAHSPFMSEQFCKRYHVFKRQRVFMHPG